MIIKLSPQRRDDTLEVTKQGDVLTLNGTALDFGPLPDGATLPMSAVSGDWIAGDVERVDGELVIRLILPLPANYSQEQAFPEDLVDVPDGPVAFPQPLPIEEPKA